MNFLPFFQHVKSGFLFCNQLISFESLVLVFFNFCIFLLYYFFNLKSRIVDFVLLTGINLLLQFKVSLCFQELPHWCRRKVAEISEDLHEVFFEMEGVPISLVFVFVISFLGHKMHLKAIFLLDKESWFLGSEILCCSSDEGLHFAGRYIHEVICYLSWSDEEGEVLFTEQRKRSNPVLYSVSRFCVLDFMNDFPVVDNEQELTFVGVNE